MECVGVSSANKTRERSVFPVGCDSADIIAMEAQKDTPTSGSELVTISGPVPLPVSNGTGSGLGPGSF